MQPMPVTAAEMLAPRKASGISASPCVAAEEPILAPHVAYDHVGVACLHGSEKKIHVPTSEGNHEESSQIGVGNQPLLALRTLGADEMSVPCELDNADCALHHFPGNRMSASHRGMGGLGYCSTSRSRN